jgi:hypothetical protein
VPDLTLDAKIDTVIGNNQEVLRNASLLIKSRAGAVEQVDLKGSLSGTPPPPLCSTTRGPRST